MLDRRGVCLRGDDVIAIRLIMDDACERLVVVAMINEALGASSPRSLRRRHKEKVAGKLFPDPLFLPWFP